MNISTGVSVKHRGQWQHVAEEQYYPPEVASPSQATGHVGRLVSLYGLAKKILPPPPHKNNCSPCFFYRVPALEPPSPPQTQKGVPSRAHA